MNHWWLLQKIRRKAAWVSAGMSLLASGIATAAPASDATGVAFYEAKVRPVLVQQCYKCHSTTADKLKAGLYLDSREGMLKGGNNGPAVVPGHPEKSLLIEAVRYTNSDMQMPPKNRLPASVVSDLVSWVQMGAPAPAGAARGLVAATSQPSGKPHNLAGIDYDILRQQHWAWQPVKPAAAPAVKDPTWCKSDIDRFVLAGLESQGLHPVGDADRVTLIRRVTFDLTGLPPTPSETQAFAADPSPEAFERVVDRLLASPAFGERWARHWLDVARYAESTGSSRNYPYAYAWRYRVYVIDAFNRDKPYNQFLTEQLAGDLLPAATPAQRDEQLVATGFLAIGIKDLNERDHFKYEMDNIDEQIDVMGRSMLATTIACARCHDHKFDPIPTADYYAIAGIFKSTEIMSGLHPRGKGNARNDLESPNLLLHLEPIRGGSSPPPIIVAADAEPASRGASLETAQDELRQLRSRALARAIQVGQEQARREFGPQLLAKSQEIAALANGSGNPLQAPPAVNLNKGQPLAVGVAEAAPSNARICLHGDSNDLGPAVPRGSIHLFQVPSITTIDSHQSGRLQLAEWVTSPQNPLTGRVMANRIWQHLFGVGIVSSADNFGTTGEAPSNPQLLDYLAGRFESDGGSVKRTIRAIVLSHAYQLASNYDPADAAMDPADRCLWRASPRRLEAEAIRDAMLSASGQLDASRPVGSPVMTMGIGELRRAGRDAEFAGGAHRSVYIPILRELVPPVLDLFDFAEPTLVTGNRDVTTVATQALFLMNNRFVLQQSRHMADRVLASPATDDAGRVDQAYRLALCRPATALEKSRAVQYVSTYSGSRSEGWASLCQALFCSAEFRYVN